MVDGIIFLRSLSPKNEEWVSNIKTPIIVVDRELSMHIPDMGMVDSSSVDAIYQATQLLIREGCRKISYIGPSPELRSSNRIEAVSYTHLDVYKRQRRRRWMGPTGSSAGFTLPFHR